VLWVLSGRSTSLPLMKIAPARDESYQMWPFTARQRS